MVSTSATGGSDEAGPGALDSPWWQYTANAEDDADLAEELAEQGAILHGDGTVSAYHHTSPEAADEIRRTGVMRGDEDGLFFTTKPHAQAAGYGPAVVEFRLPLNAVQLDDVFGDEAHLRLPTARPGASVDVSKYLTKRAAASGRAPETDRSWLLNGEGKALGWNQDNDASEMYTREGRNGELHVMTWLPQRKVWSGEVVTPSGHSIYGGVMGKNFPSAFEAHHSMERDFASHLGTMKSFDPDAGGRGEERLEDFPEGTAILEPHDLGLNLSSEEPKSGYGEYEPHPYGKGFMKLNSNWWEYEGEPSESQLDDLFAEHDRLGDEYDRHQRETGQPHPDDLSGLPAGETVTKRYDRTPDGLVEHHWEDDLLPPHTSAKTEGWDWEEAPPGRGGPDDYPDDDEISKTADSDAPGATPWLDLGQIQDENNKTYNVRFRRRSNGVYEGQAVDPGVKHQEEEPDPEEDSLNDPMLGDDHEAVVRWRPSGQITWRGVKQTHRGGHLSVLLKQHLADNIPDEVAPPHHSHDLTPKGRRSLERYYYEYGDPHGDIKDALGITDEGDDADWSEHYQPMTYKAAAEPQLQVTDYQGEEGNRNHITRDESGMVPIEWIRGLLGAAGERPGYHRNYQGDQWEHFKNQVAAGAPGYSEPIFITVDHNGDPLISEGNHRRDAYVANRATHAPVHIRYFGHAERQGTLGERYQRRLDDIDRQAREELAAERRQQRLQTEAMPRDDGFLRGLRYDITSHVQPGHPTDGFHVIKAWHPDGSDAGYIEWDAFDGRILDAAVAGGSRRKGLGTELYNRAHQHSVDNGLAPPEHAWDDLSDDARGWITGMGHEPEKGDLGYEDFYRRASVDVMSEPKFHEGDDIDQHMAEHRAWKKSIRHALSMGHITPEEARSAGYHGSGHDQGGPTGMRWQPLPSTLYHVTTDLPGVMQHGLKSRDELAQERGKGLGGGESDTISYTDDPATAQRIHEALHEFHGVLNGKKSMQEMYDEARVGHGADRPWSDMVDNVEFGSFEPARDSALKGYKYDFGLPSTQAEMDEKHPGEGWEPHPASFSYETPKGVLYNSWHRPMTEDELRDKTASFYKTWAAGRMHAGGPEDPMFFLTDTKGFAAMDPKNFGIVKVHPKPGAQGYPVAALGEWRTTTGQNVDVDPQQMMQREGSWSDLDLEHPYYYHVSPTKIPVGEFLKPPGKGWTNFDESSGEHSYMTPSLDAAERYRYWLWEQGHPNGYLHEVKAHGDVEPDPHDGDAVRTKDPVEVIYHHDTTDDEPMQREAAYGSYILPEDYHPDLSEDERQDQYLRDTNSHPDDEDREYDHPHDYYYATGVDPAWGEHGPHPGYSDEQAINIIKANGPFYHASDVPPEEMGSHIDWHKGKANSSTGMSGYRNFFTNDKEFAKRFYGRYLYQVEPTNWEDVEADPHGGMLGMDDGHPSLGHAAEMAENGGHLSMQAYHPLRITGVEDTGHLRAEGSEVPNRKKIDDLIDQWHDAKDGSPAASMQLHEWLGMTPEQYQQHVIEGKKMPKKEAAMDESGLKAAGIAVIAMDTGRVLMLQRALNPVTCPCGMPVAWDEQNGWQHEDGSVSHDNEFYGQSVSDLLDGGHEDLPNGRCPACGGTGEDADGSECVNCDGGGTLEKTADWADDPRLTSREILARFRQHPQVEKTAMPRDEDYLSNLSFEFTPYAPLWGGVDHEHQLGAYDYDGAEHGFLRWNPETGVVKNIETVDNGVRQGLGTELLRRAKEICRKNGYPELRHSYILTEDGKELVRGLGDERGGLVLQREGALEFDKNEGVWEFPGGTLEDGENPRDAAVREFSEEVGQNLPPGVFVGAWLSPTGTEQPVYKGFIYLVQNERDIDLAGARNHINPDDPDGDMTEQCAWWDIEDAKNNPALRPECKTTPWDEFEIWADKSVRNNREVVAMVSKIAAQPPADAPHRRAIKTGPFIDTDGENDYVDYGGRHYYRKYNGGKFDMQDAKDAADKEYLGSLLRRSIGANAAHVIRSPRSDDPPHTVYSEVIPEKTNPRWTLNGGYSNATDDTPGGILAGLGDMLQVEGDRRGNNWRELQNGEPYVWDFAYSDPARMDDLGPYQNRWGHVYSDFSHHYTKDHVLWSHALLGDNPLAPNTDVPRIEAALKFIRPEYERAGRGDWHDELMDRWDELKQHAAGDDEHPVLEGRVLPHEAGVRVLSASVFSAINDLVMAGMPGHRIRTSGEISDEHNSALAANGYRSLKPLVSEQLPGQGQIYAKNRRFGQDRKSFYDFIAPVMDEKGVSSWVKGNSLQDPHEWSVHPWNNLNEAFGVSPRPTNPAGSSEDRPRKFNPPPSGKPSVQEGDVPLDSKGHQIIESVPDGWEPFARFKGGWSTTGSSKIWWAYQD